MSGNMLRSLLNWLTRHDDLPLLTVPSAAVDDSDTDFFGDMMYLRGLLDDLVHGCVNTHEATARPLPRACSAVLDLTLEELRDDDAWLIPLAVIA